MPSNEGLTPASSRVFRVLIIGGSYGGLATALTLADLTRGQTARFNYTPGASAPPTGIPVQITVVDERDGYYHLIGSPKALSCDKFAPKSWTCFSDIPALKAPNMEFVRGSVTAINPELKNAQILDLQSQETRHEPYDYLVAASGLRRVFPTVPQSLKRDEFLEEAKMHKECVRNAQDGIVIIGGGAVGVEMAAELKELDSQQKVTLIHSRDRLLSAEPLPDDFKERVCTVLQGAGVHIILGQRVIDHKAVETAGEGRTWHLTLADGTEIRAGHVMSAISKSLPTSSYFPEETLDHEGYVKIHPTCQLQGSIPNVERHFAIGDIASWPGIKRCGGAMMHGYHAATNVHQLMLSEHIGSKPEFISLQAAPPMIGLALGKTAVTYNTVEGTRSGEDLMEAMFGEDMGNTGMSPSAYPFLSICGLTVFSMLELPAFGRAMSRVAD